MLREYGSSKGYCISRRQGLIRKFPLLVNRLVMFVVPYSLIVLIYG